MLLKTWIFLAISLELAKKKLQKQWSAKSPDYNNEKTSLRLFN